MDTLSDETLGTYKHILMYDDERVVDALVSLRDQEGYDWWYLVVVLEAGGYAVAPFSALQEPLKERGGSFLETPLGALVGSVLTVTEAVEQDQHSATDAQERAYRTPARALVVLRDGEFHGILLQGMRRGLFESSLVQLAGEYAPLPQQGLWSPRRMKPKKSTSKSQG